MGKLNPRQSLELLDLYMHPKVEQKTYLNI
jgi:hypothetical protein